MIEFYRDAFDSQILGCECYKLWLNEPLSGQQVEDALASVGERIDRVACFSVYAQSNFRALERLGFQLISVRNTYSRPVDGFPPAAALPAIDRVLASNHTARLSREDLTPLAVVIGETSRYFKDHSIPANDSLRVYQTWLENSLYNGYAAESVLAFDESGRLAGIHTLKVKGETGIVDLIGVAPGFQQGGLGASLLAAGVEAMRQRRARTVEVVTENENVPAARFYQKHGFRLQSMQLVWHKSFSIKTQQEKK